MARLAAFLGRLACTAELLTMIAVFYLLGCFALACVVSTLHEGWTGRALMPPAEAWALLGLIVVLIHGRAAWRQTAATETR